MLMAGFHYQPAVTKHKNNQTYMFGTLFKLELVIV